MALIAPYVCSYCGEPLPTHAAGRAHWLVCPKRPSWWKREGEGATGSKKRAQ